MSGILLDKTMSKMIKALFALALVFCMSCGEIEESGFVKETFVSEDQFLAEQSGPQSESDDNRLLSIYGAARLGSAMLEDGTNNFLWFLVLINVFVGIFNLVPLLPLDGGHAAIATYERLRSRKGKRYVADINKLIPVTWVVITVLVGIALIALYRDIVDLPNFG